MTADCDKLLALAYRCEAGTYNNKLDVAVEVALFKPGTVYSACRANDAGTKVIYTDKAGNEVTCWADDWTAPKRQASTANALRALARAE